MTLLGFFDFNLGQNYKKIPDFTFVFSLQLAIKKIKFH